MKLVRVAKKGEFDLKNDGAFMNGSNILRTQNQLNILSLFELGIEAALRVPRRDWSFPCDWMARNDEFHNVLSLNRHR